MESVVKTKSGRYQTAHGVPHPMPASLPRPPPPPPNIGIVLPHHFPSTSGPSPLEGAAREVNGKWQLRPAGPRIVTDGSMRELAEGLHGAMSQMHRTSLLEPDDEQGYRTITIPSDYDEVTIRHKLIGALRTVTSPRTKATLSPGFISRPPPEPNVYAQLLSLTSPDTKVLLDHHAKALKSLETKVEDDIRQIGPKRGAPKARKISSAMREPTRVREVDNTNGVPHPGSIATAPDKVVPFGAARQLKPKDVVVGNGPSRPTAPQWPAEEATNPTHPTMTSLKSLSPNASVASSAMVAIAERFKRTAVQLYGNSGFAPPQHAVGPPLPLYVDAHPKPVRSPPFMSTSPRFIAEIKVRSGATHGGGVRPESRQDRAPTSRKVPLPAKVSLPVSTKEAGARQPRSSSLRPARSMSRSTARGSSLGPASRIPSRKSSLSTRSSVAVPGHPPTLDSMASSPLPETTGKANGLQATPATAELAVQIATNMLAEVIEKKLPRTPLGNHNLEPPRSSPVDAKPAPLQQPSSESASSSVNAPASVAMEPTADTWRISSGKSKSKSFNAIAAPDLDKVGTAISRWRLHYKHLGSSSGNGDGDAKQPPQRPAPPPPSGLDTEKPVFPRRRSYTLDRLMEENRTQRGSLEQAAAECTSANESGREIGRQCPIYWRLAMSAYTAAMPRARVLHIDELAGAFYYWRHRVQLHRGEKRAAQQLQVALIMKRLNPYFAAWFNLTLATVHRKRTIAQYALNSLREYVRQKRVSKGLLLLGGEYFSTRSKALAVSQWLKTTKDHANHRLPVAAVRTKIVNMRLRHGVAFWFGMAKSAITRRSFAKQVEAQLLLSSVLRTVRKWRRVVRRRRINAIVDQRVTSERLTVPFRAWAAFVRQQNSKRILRRLAATWYRTRYRLIALRIWQYATSQRAAESAVRWHLARGHIQRLFSSWHQFAHKRVQLSYIAETVRSHGLGWQVHSSLQCWHMAVKIARASRQLFTRRLRHSVRTWCCETFQRKAIERAFDKARAGERKSKLSYTIQGWRRVLREQQMYQRASLAALMFSRRRAVQTWLMRAIEWKERRAIVNDALLYADSLYSQRTATRAMSWLAQVFRYRRKLWERANAVSSKIRIKLLRLSLNVLSHHMEITQIRQQLADMHLLSLSLTRSRRCFLEWRRLALRIPLFFASRNVRLCRVVFKALAKYVKTIKDRRSMADIHMHHRDKRLKEKCWHAWGDFMAFKEAKRGMNASLDLFSKTRNARRAFTALREHVVDSRENRSRLARVSLLVVRTCARKALRAWEEMLNRRILLYLKRASPNLRPTDPIYRSSKMTVRVAQAISNSLKKKAGSPSKRASGLAPDAPLGHGVFLLGGNKPKQFILESTTHLGDGTALPSALLPRSLGAFHILAVDELHRAQVARERCKPPVQSAEILGPASTESSDKQPQTRMAANLPDSAIFSIDGTAMRKSRFPRFASPVKRVANILSPPASPLSGGGAEPPSPSWWDEQINEAVTPKMSSAGSAFQPPPVSMDAGRLYLTGTTAENFVGSQEVRFQRPVSAVETNPSFPLAAQGASGTEQVPPRIPADKWILPEMRSEIEGKVGTSSAPRTVEPFRAPAVVRHPGIMPELGGLPHAPAPPPPSKLAVNEFAAAPADAFRLPNGRPKSIDIFGLRAESPDDVAMLTEPPSSLNPPPTSLAPISSSPASDASGEVSDSDVKPLMTRPRRVSVTLDEGTLPLPELGKLLSIVQNQGARPGVMSLRRSSEPSILQRSRRPSLVATVSDTDVPELRG